MHYAATLFVSAFILFLVQPLIGKLVLPKLGGTPQVWNTCMVFFQMVLLLGYFYTHAVSTRLKPRVQLLLHGAVILLPFIVFVVRPFWFIREGWTPPLGSNPIFSTLYLLATVVGVPFFVVSTTAPLLQKWFGLTGHPASRDPYFLYGASNLGSMLSLLVYPVLIEPFTVLNTQSVIWMAGYAFLALTVFACIAMVWKPSETAVLETTEKAPSVAVAGELATAIKPAIKPTPHAPASHSLAAQTEEVDMLRRLKWVALAAVPSSMMLGVTSHITTDLSPIPLFWLVPLALYLLSFILVFARWPVVWTESPHLAMVYLQPFAIAFMILSEVIPSEGVWGAVAANTIGFFLTTMVCHGELAKDRPSTRYLTEFYLMMSVGGMLGGMLNGLIAPLFPWVFEFNAAIIAACLLRPTITGLGNWLDNIVAGYADTTEQAPVKPVKGKAGAAHSVAHAAPTQGLGYGLDIAVGLGVLVISFILLFTMLRSDGGTRESLRYAYLAAYGIPLVIALVFMARPIRFGLAIAALILAHEFYTANQESGTIQYRSRSYFGVIRVKLGQDSAAIADGGREVFPYTTLIHGHINHGQNYKANEDSNKDYSRLATTYYHRRGPAGIVMEKFNWFKDGSTTSNTFWSDTRIAAGLASQGAFGALGTSILPMGALVEVWAEPPFATIGLGTGTMASYARPFQHCHFYEIDDEIRRLSLPESGRGKAFFNYLQGGLDRGAHVQVLMGDARQRMALPYANYYEAQQKPQKVPNGGPEKFYHMMVVDAFSSDAIPAHLLTKEAFKMYFDHLVEEGVLCVHTSNRFVDLPRVVSDVSESLDLVCKRGHDLAPQKDKGHFTSEWVMVARKAPRALGERKYLQHLDEPEGYRKAFRGGDQPYERYWNVPETYGGKYLWTDDYYNLLNILRVVLPRGS